MDILKYLTNICPIILENLLKMNALYRWAFTSDYFSILPNSWIWKNNFNGHINKS